MQIGLAILLVAALLGFEIDIRLFTDWKELARPSPWFESGAVYKMLGIHLCIAIPTSLLWGFVIWRGLQRFPANPQPNEHSKEHRFWGRVAAALMFVTTTTGCLFYWMAFVA